MGRASKGRQTSASADLRKVLRARRAYAKRPAARNSAGGDAGLWLEEFPGVSAHAVPAPHPPTLRAGSSLSPMASRLGPRGEGWGEGPAPMVFAGGAQASGRHTAVPVLAE